MAGGEAGGVGGEGDGEVEGVDGVDRALPAKRCVRMGS